MDPKLKISAGLDVHHEVIVAAILEEKEDGRIEESVKEFSTYPGSIKELANWLIAKNVEQVVMESTGVYWKSVYAALEEAGVPAIVANARYIRQIPGKKTDVKDSVWLASLLRCGLIKGSFIPNKDLRELRLITRYRVKVNKMIASETNRLHKILTDSGIRLSMVLTDLKGVSAQRIIEGIIEGKPLNFLVTQLQGVAKKKQAELIAMLKQPISHTHRFLLKKINDHIKYLQNELIRLDEEILQAMKPYEAELQILQTIPGIDESSAASIIAETGVDMGRFGKVEQFCSWAGVCPGNNESAGKSFSGRMRKGSPTLRSTLCQVANSAVKTTSQFKGYYQSLVVRRGHKRAVMATAHKILRVIYKLIDTTKAYIDPGINYEEMMVKKNAPRWIKCLVKYGHITRAAR